MCSRIKSFLSYCTRLKLYFYPVFDSMRRCWIIFSALSIRLRPAPAFCHTFIDMMTRAPRMSFTLASYMMWLIHRYMTWGRRKPPHVSGWIRLSWPPDCNLQSRPRHQTDVRVRFRLLRFSSGSAAMGLRPVDRHSPDLSESEPARCCWTRQINLPPTAALPNAPSV